MFEVMPWDISRFTDIWLMKLPLQLDTLQKQMKQSNL